MLKRFEYASHYLYQTQLYLEDDDDHTQPSTTFLRRNTVDIAASRFKDTNGIGIPDEVIKE